MFGYGIIGCGWVASSHAAGVVALSGQDVRLVAVADADLRRAEMLATQFGADNVYDDYRALLKRPDISAVSICLPDHLHAEASMAAADAGKHVLCEKPLAMNVASASEMIAKFGKAGLRLGLVMNRRYTPSVIWVRRLMRAGGLGRILMVSVVHSSALTGNEDRSSPWRGRRGLATGGILATQAIHFLDLLFWLAGPAMQVKAWSDRLASDDLTFEDTVALSFRLESGALATFATTNGSPIYDDVTGTRFEFHGSGGYLILEGNSVREYKCAKGVEVGTPTEVALPALPNSLSLPFGPGHIYEVADFVGAVRRGAYAPVPGEAGRYLLAVIEAAERSSSLDQGVVIGSPGLPYDPPGPISTSQSAYLLD